MKRVLSSILISFVILANLLAPFSVGWGKSGVEVKKNEVVADFSIIPLSVNSSSPLLRKTYVKINGIFSSTEKIDVKDLSVEYFISDNQNEVTTLTTVSGSQTGSAFQIYTKNENNVTTYDYWFGLQIEKYANNKGVFDFENNKTYYVYVKVGQLKDGVAIKVGQSKVEQFVAGVPSETGDYYITDEGKAVFLEAKKEAIANGSTEEQAVILAQKKVGNEKDDLYNNKNPDNMPDCSIVPAKIMGCIAQGFYYVIFMPTSYLFALSGTFFDSTFAYSVQDTSYRSAFVVQGWGLVRDFCNLFFIFVLLYVAIGTTLSLHSMKTKEVIINVVIIGLFINFSLFATQLIIDASNITARVFYNSDAIKITENGANGVTEATPGLVIGEGGVIPISAALVNKINPQNIILHSKEVNNIPDKEGRSKNNADVAENLGAGSFILIVIIASVVNIVGIIVFLSVGLIFVSRVIGLWLAMIIAPLAFFTYILPDEMAGTKMIGWKKWWPETIKMAFLAPVFMFFMYIILKFLSLDLIADVSNKTISKDGLGFFVATLIPFAFIMILMMKAKEIAKDMSGELGQQVTGGVAALGGALLGGAALGTAFLGRRVLGAGIAKLSRSEDAKKRADHKIVFNKKIEDWKASGAIGPKPTWEGYKQANNITTKEDIFTRLGSKLNEKQARVNVLDHATSDIEEAKKTAHIVDSKGETLSDSNMSGEDEKELEKAFSKNKKADVESNMRKGLDASGKKPAFISDSIGNQYEGEEAYKKAKRGDIENAYVNDPNNHVLNNNPANLTDKDKKNIENELNQQFNVDLSKATKTELEGYFKHIRDESRQGVSMLTRGFARSNKASYDFRNLSEVKAGKKDSFMSKIPTAMIAGVALGVRTGLKSSGVNHGQGQADFTKDLQNTITEALKGIKVELPKAPSGGGGGHDVHGGGGGHH